MSHEYAVRLRKLSEVLGEHPEMLKIARLVLKQADRGRQQVIEGATASVSCQKWLDALAHYRGLTSRVVEQTGRRVICSEQVPSAEKIVSLFEPHTDIIVKNFAMFSTATRSI